MSDSSHITKNLAYGALGAAKNLAGGYQDRRTDIKTSDSNYKNMKHGYNNVTTGLRYGLGLLVGAVGVGLGAVAQLETGARMLMGANTDSRVGEGQVEVESATSGVRNNSPAGKTLSKSFNKSKILQSLGAAQDETIGNIIDLNSKIEEKELSLNNNETYKQYNKLHQQSLASHRKKAGNRLRFDSESIDIRKRKKFKEFKKTKKDKLDKIKIEEKELKKLKSKKRSEERKRFRLSAEQSMASSMLYNEEQWEKVEKKSAAIASEIQRIASPKGLLQSAAFMASMTLVLLEQINNQGVLDTF